MKLHGNDYIYEAAPPFLDNRSQPAEQMIWFGLKAIGQRDADKIEAATVAAYNDLARDKAAEVVQGKTLELIRSKVASINNLVVDGQPVTTFDQMYQIDACKELVQWIMGAVHSIITLSRAERKNFLPESNTPA